jgi:4a-hydroxytetrahydrobiopterin dehydratase
MENWREEKNALQATFKFKDFAAAFAFMTEVALHAEKMDHHPTWTNTWNRVDVLLTTHDAGNMVTDKDWALARTINETFKRYA